MCIGNIHCRAAYILFNSVLNIINYIKWFKFSAERFLSYSPSPVISICLSDSLFLLACVSVSVSVCLFISSVSVFFGSGEKIQLNAYLIVYFNVSHSMSAHCCLDKRTFHLLTLRLSYPFTLAFARYSFESCTRQHSKHKM